MALLQVSGVLLALCVAIATVHSADVKAEYYTSVTFDCNYTLHNFTSNSPIENMYWLLPDGSQREENFNNGHVSVDADFNIKIDRIDDVDFGYYVCIIVRSDFTVDKIRHGLNIDGAYFGDLLEKYTKKAMVGGIAAGSVFVILAGLCIVWQFRYHKRIARNKAVDELDMAIDGYDLKAYTNVGMDLEDGTPRSERKAAIDNVANGNSPALAEKRF